MNRTIIKFTAMSACLDPLKLLYVAMIGFLMPIGMKVASVMHGASDSQTFEMLTGKVGVAFVMMVLCLGLAGNTATQSGRGGEYLALIFTRPISRCEYIISKWLTLTIIGAGFTGLQNIVISCIGLACGESITGQAILSMVIERFLDAALISAAMILTMLEKNPAFQIVAILAFYVWLAGQTIPPVSIATGGSGIQDLSIEATKIMLTLSQAASQAVLPTLNVYDLLSSPATAFSPILAYISMLTLYLVFAIKVTNRREFFYGTN